ncbi:MAG: hypothetical protein KKF50_04535 [Nanoarchaeota archaeon]|nr:hypothetical protein [Nanoarchaeota archaeon]
MEKKADVFDAIKRIGVIVFPFIVGLATYAVSKNCGSLDPAVVGTLVSAPAFVYSRLVIGNDYNLF